MHKMQVDMVSNRKSCFEHQSNSRRGIPGSFSLGVIKGLTSAALEPSMEGFILPWGSGKVFIVYALHTTMDLAIQQCPYVLLSFGLLKRGENEAVRGLRYF
jgi:hypothetical protein